MAAEGTGFLGHGGHAAGQWVRVDPALRALLPGAHGHVQVVPGVCHCHDRQTVHR